jgi:hypothetical protein
MSEMLSGKNQNWRINKMQVSKLAMARRQRSFNRYQKMLKRKRLKLWGKPFAKKLSNLY